jgi:hypothetical protein
MNAGEEIPCGETAPPAGDHGRLGGYDIASRTQSLVGLREVEDQVRADLERITEQYPDGAPEGVRKDHQRTYDLYYRVRTHEKAHFYQGLSTATELARTFAENDLTRFLFMTLEAVPPGQDLWLPLLRWAHGAAPGCPPELTSVISRFRTADIVYAALDGDADAADRDPGRVRAFFPAASRPLAADPGFRLGRRYLAEGAAKAAEWIYVLRSEPEALLRAESDLASSPEVYRRAILHVRQLIPEVPLPGQLQAVVLCADFALNPEVPVELWPDIYAAEAADAARLAPGPRFVLVSRLLPEIPAACFAAKENLAAELTSRVSDMLGWLGPDQATRAAMAAIDGVLASSQHARLLALLPGSDHPIRRLRMALEARLEDTWAFVPPVNASLINARRLAPSGFRGSTLTPMGEIDRLLAPERTWFTGRLARQLIYAQCPECPLRSDLSYQAEFTADEACPELGSGRCAQARSRAAIRHEFLACRITGNLLEHHLGSGWSARLRFFVSGEDPGAFRPGANRPRF